MDDFVDEFPPEFKPVPSHKYVISGRIPASAALLPSGGFWRYGTKNITPKIKVDTPSRDVVQ
jgi:hypothetical protein